MWLSKEKAVRDLVLGKYIIPVSSRTCVMGVLNVTPDSFSDGGEYLDINKAVEKAEKMVSEGVDIIDIGGESSRPGASGVSLEEELKRVIPIVSAIIEKIDVPISIDTYKSEVARQALEAGAVIINDITALSGDDKMAGTIAEFNAGVVLMHMKGDPLTMQQDPLYLDVIDEVFEFLERSIKKAIDSGINSNRIIVDPGIGFGKRIDDNIDIINELFRFQFLEKPIMIGTSRKSFIGKITGRDVKHRDFGTAATITSAIMNGADIVRVHDIKEMVDVSRMTDAIKGIK